MLACGEGAKNYRFVNGDYTWTGAQKASARAGIEQWDDIKNYTGNPLFNDIENGGGNNEFEVVRVLTPGNDPSNTGHIYCNHWWYGDRIEIKTTQTGGMLEDTAAHEFGHAHMLDHIGDGDSHDSKWPLMSTCGPYSTSSVRRMSASSSGQCTVRAW